MPTQKLASALAPGDVITVPWNRMTYLVTENIHDDSHSTIERFTSDDLVDVQVRINYPDTSIRCLVLGLDGERIGTIHASPVEVFEVK